MQTGAAESMSRVLFGDSRVSVAPTVAPTVAPRRTKKAPPGLGKGPLTWARSEGLEPPTF